MSCEEQCEKRNCSLQKRVPDCHTFLEDGHFLVGKNLSGHIFMSVFHKSCHGIEK